MPDWTRSEFDWDDANVDHLSERHGVEPEQVEEVFHNDPHVRRVGSGNYYAYEQDDAGRYFFVVFVIREGAVRAISARSMNSHERRLYARHR